jgi:hypothetical protein
MKPGVKSFIVFGLVFIFSFNLSNAQKSNLPKFLRGEWIKVDQTGTRINDTITLTKKIIESKLDSRWDFELPDKLTQQYFTESKDRNSEVISIATTFKCNYDKKSKLLRIFASDYNAYFKIVYSDKQTINLICVK